MLATAPRSLRSRELKVFRDRIVPEPVLTMSEWADLYRVLSPESSAEPGPWRTDRAPYLRGIMDAISDIAIETVVIMKSSQVGGTEVILNAIGYYVDQDPSPILVIQPNAKPMGEAFSKDRLTPMFRDSARLRGVVAAPKSRDSGNTIMHKTFRGGALTIVGANAPAGLASRPIRILLCDEVDRYEESAGNEGDPVSLGDRRTQTFWNRKKVLNSTPGLKGFSRIEAAYDAGDQRKYFVPCPECGHRQVLRWAGLKWDTDQPETAAYVCGAGHTEAERKSGAKGCGSVIPEEDKGAMLAAGEWVAAFPDRRVASFHICALYSPWARWSELAREFLEAKEDRERLQTFVNTILGETWEEKGQRLATGDLEQRAEVWVRQDQTRIEVPDGVGILCAGVDVQKDRFELLVRGYGNEWETWDIFHERIVGDVQLAATQGRLLALLNRTFEHENGRRLPIQCAMIDSGYEASVVYAFVDPLEGRGFWASKGDDGAPKKEMLTRGTRPNKASVTLWTIGTFPMKKDLFNRMQLKRPGPRFIHLRRGDQEFCNGFDAEYFAQFGSEKIVVQNRVPRFRQIRDRNEAIDLHVLADAAYRALGASMSELMPDLVETVRKEPEPTPEPLQEQHDDGGGWASGGGRWGAGWR